MNQWHAGALSSPSIQRAQVRLTLSDNSIAIVRGQDDAEVYSWRACANVRLERLEPARHDCEQAEERALGDPLTHGCWGNLHLALHEYDHAIARYDLPWKLRQEPVGILN
jgi:hypothetical protein